MFISLTILLNVLVVYGAEHCCFPTQMEGTTTLVSNLQIYYYRNARFAVDFIEGRFIILHPSQDEVYLLYDYLTETHFERFYDGTCLQRPLQEVELMMDCVPDDWVLAGDEFKVGNSHYRKTVNVWTHGNRNDEDYSYVIVEKENCMPVTIMQNLHHATNQRTDSLRHITLGLKNASILYPDLSDCVENNLG